MTVAALDGMGPLHHVGIAVPSLEEALPFWRDTLGYRATEPREVPGTGVRLCFLECGAARIELVEALDPDSGIGRFVAERGRPTLHHVCFEVADLAVALAELAARGHRLIDLVPRAGAEGMVAFLHPSVAGGVLVELLEAEVSADRPGTGIHTR